jgi:hypothetical protein
MKVFKTETTEDLTVEQYNALTELYIYEQEKELKEIRNMDTARGQGKGNTVRISSK